MFTDDFGLNGIQYIRENICSSEDYFTPKVDKYEGRDHFRLKKKIFKKLMRTFGDNERFFIFTELQQVKNPFYNVMTGNSDLKYRLDICVVTFITSQKPFVIDIEIDGKNHYTERGLEKSKIRDRLMFDRYGLGGIHRVDVADPELDKFFTEVSSKIAASLERR